MSSVRGTFVFYAADYEKFSSSKKHVLIILLSLSEESEHGLARSLAHGLIRLYSRYLLSCILRTDILQGFSGRSFISLQLWEVTSLFLLTEECSVL